MRCEVSALYEERAHRPWVLLPVAPMGVSVVTGGARGIGRAVALALGAAGHAVCVNDTGVALDGRGPDPGPAEEVAAEIRTAGGRAMASALDARDRALAERLVSDVGSWAGEHPTVLVHSAGTLRDAMLHKASDDDWNEVLGSHLSVAIEVTRAMAPALRAERFGRIVYVGGAAGLVGSVGQAPYAVAKAGLFGLTRATALEMAGRDVCVNYVAPFAFTRMTRSIPPVNEQLRTYLRDAPLATPEDVAPLISWLCSPAASGVSGQILGGRGAEVCIWSQPRPLAGAVDADGWTTDRLIASGWPQLEPHLVPLESEFDLFGGPPTAVSGRQR